MDAKSSIRQKKARWRSRSGIREPLIPLHTDWEKFERIIALKLEQGYDNIDPVAVLTNMHLWHDDGTVVESRPPESFFADAVFFRLSDGL